MADIFLSYTRTDATRAGQLAEELERRGLTVFWDTEVLPGQRWRDVIHEELVEAACVIVIWSSESSQSRWVVEEASEALEAGKLVPVLLDGTLPPFGFRGVEAANLAGWIPGAPSPEFENLVSAVRQIVDAAPTAAIASQGEPSSPGEVEIVPTEAAGAGGAVGVESGPGEGVADHDIGDGGVAIEEEDGTPAPVGERIVASERPTLETADGGTGGGGAVDTGIVDEVPARSNGGEVTSSTTVTTKSAPQPPVGVIERLGTGGIVALGAAAVLIVVLIVVFAGGDGDGGNGPGTTIAGGATTTSVQGEVVESDTVTAFRVATPPAIDGDLGDWADIAELSRLRQEVFRDPDVTERLGDDSPGVVAARYDDAALYLAVVSEDDVYSQLNTGNQIWRGDALDINLTTAAESAISERPDGDDFQLTMTPRDAEGRAATVWFTGNGSGFADNTTSQPVTLAGAIDPGGSWVLEAAIPWSVFGLSGPPETDLAALLAVFDNDGEVVDGAPQQTVILGHTDAEFQRPRTWGTLRLER